MTDQRTVDDLLDSGDVVMLTTADLHARPMTVQQVDGHVVWFLTDRNAEWVSSSTDGDRIGLALADDDDALWVSLTAELEQVDDPELNQRLWSKFELAWFDGPEDPSLTALRCTVREGEWWDAPSGTVRRLLRLVAAVADDDAEVGEQGGVA